MTDVMEMRQEKSLGAGSKAPSVWSKPWVATLLYSVVSIVTLLVFNRNATDYVGADNDDSMRLVEVRDFLGGQSWFDMTQYRLGLESGTLMHWSRLIDLPIATLIAFFRLFAAPERAEALALAVWPLVLVVPLLYFMGLAGRRIGGTVGQHVSLGLTVLTIVCCSRFTPGSIDHDNAQLGLVALMTAMLVDDRFRPLSFAAAGVAAAVAIAIGAETTPFVAVVCIVVAVLWAWEGEVFAAAARAFALALTVSISIAFFSTTPPHLYSNVTCDNLSLGFYGIASVGGVALLLSAVLASRLSRPLRFAVLAGCGLAVFLTTLVLAPQCLRSPLADLDPMIVHLWLDNVIEAQSILSIAHHQPGDVGAFYAVGFLGIVVCLFRIGRGDRVQLHAILLALLLVNWAIAVVQVRGSLFANFLAIPPLTLFILDLRRLSNSDPENVNAAFLYIVGVLISVPAVWALGGNLAAGKGANLFSKTTTVLDEASADCSSREGIAPIAGLDPGVVVAPSNMGSPLLRFTRHRTLSGPYHRDQAGMLAEMKIGLADPRAAEALLDDAHVTLFAYCAADPQTRALAEMKPDGLYAQLSKGKVPGYLEALSPANSKGVQFFRFKP